MDYESPTKPLLRDLEPQIPLDHTETTTHDLLNGTNSNILMLTHIDKLRAIIKTRELENIKLKHENTILKQVERRQARDIKELEMHNEDAPRIIRGLRNEIVSLKVNLKNWILLKPCVFVVEIKRLFLPFIIKCSTNPIT